MKVSNRYRHSNSLDADIYVNNIYEVDETYMQCGVTWLSQRNNVYLAFDLIIIRLKDLKNWRLIKEDLI